MELSGVLHGSAIESAPASKNEFALRGAARWWAVIATTAVLAFATQAGSIPVAMSFVAFGGVGYVLTRRIDPTSARLFMCVYSIGVVAALLLYAYYTNVHGVPYWGGGSDELHFEEVGTRFAESYGVFDYGRIRGGLVRADHNSVAYIYIVGILYKFAGLFGEVHTMVPRLFNLACLGMVAVGTYRLGLRADLPERLARAAGMFAGTLPMMMWTASQTLRDTIVSALFVGLVAIWTPARSVGYRPRLVVALAASALIIMALVDLRLPQAFVAAIATVIGVLISDAARGRLSRWILILGGGVVAIYAFVTIARLVSGQTAFLVGQAVYYSTYRVEDVGGGLSAIVFTTPPPLGWILRIVYAAVTPLPILTSQLDLLWLSVGTIIHILCLPYFLRGLAAFRMQREWLMIVAAFAMLFLGMALISFQTRHIVQYLPMAVLIAAHGYRLLRRPRLWASLMAMSGAFLGLAYAALKL